VPSALALGLLVLLLPVGGRPPAAVALLLLLAEGGAPAVSAPLLLLIKVVVATG
jgi:hypothetical protein